jgi:malonate transporter and related proteins
MTGAVLVALLPVVLLIALGHVLRRTEFVAATFWPQAERLGYYVLLPALFWHGLATAKLDDLPIPELAAALLLSTISVAVCLVLARPAMRVDAAGFTSIFQGGIRFNNFVAVTLAAQLFGAKGIALAALCNAVIVPTVNVLCVLVFLRFGTMRASFAGIARQIALNPLVLACAGGILFQVLGLHFPSGLEPALKALGQAALAIGLLCVGAAVQFQSVVRWARPLVTASLAKFVLMPLAAAFACGLFGLGGPAALVVMLFHAMPTASSSYILARQLGGDAPMMAVITASQTVLAAAAIPLIMAFFNY